jgi:hypothetical protein
VRVEKGPLNLASLRRRDFVTQILWVRTRVQSHRAAVGPPDFRTERRQTGHSQHALSAKEFEEGIAGTSLANFCFAWSTCTVALALGYGSLYNHSFRPNARYEDVWPQTKEFTALRDIEPGEEITVNYNGKPRSRAKVWFEVVEAARTRTNGSRSGGINLDQPI